MAGSLAILSVIVWLSFYLQLTQASELPNTCVGPIDWDNCPDSLLLQYATYKVPLDYAHPEIGNARLALARLPASNSPRLGTIFLNPGEPGGSGIADIKAIASVVTVLTNGQYDVVGWDPRGFNQTLYAKPHMWVRTAQERQDFFNGTIINNGIEVRGSFTSKNDLESLFSTLERFGQKCAEGNPFLKYLGTTAVTRDIVSMKDCLDGPDKPVNYYGISYGSVIGAYLVNSIFGDAEAALAGFTSLCAQAGPSNCSFATEGSTGASLLREITDLIDIAYDKHKTVLTNITSFEIRLDVYDGLTLPTAWHASLVPQLVSIRNSLQESMSITLSTKRFKPRNVLFQQTSTPVDPVLPAFLGGSVILCLDSIDQPNVTTKDVYDEVVRTSQSVSPLFGEAIVGILFFSNCHRFPVRAVERFTGPFNSTLANPIIIIGNKADPRTPISNARKIAAALGPFARLLEQDGFGHTPSAENSDCTLGMIQRYLLTGELPENGEVCAVNRPYFRLMGQPLPHRVNSPYF
ncbi:hypothetical protein M422DRAFT_34658 [Sphaerobolus stellatus SS14]|uniref:Peptidase S33 tripeptidyl aminopeptidase-like C-terminal domain-containing protein n=1 Tax=Sphaerobolus stellatus (strain SS14) TaxID=990650 RepID=A0A0C9VD14_SPHS4|nr:hypothetical protein M422DRAFT_34658 [Sphaerobolus stellatus SS14]